MSSTIISDLILSMCAIILAIILSPYIFKVLKLSFVKTNYKKLGTSSQIRLIRQIYDAIQVLSKEKTGAILTIINKQKIDALRTDGIKINADISSPLIISIFNKYSPLHDGAIVIENNKIIYAGTYYKITSKSLDNRYGARHRAAIGISEQCDALTIVVSEETGSISFVKDGNISKVSLNDFQGKIVEYLK